MFPSNLHKNILQLDKQISLLESECKVMEIERRKKCANFKEPLTKCSKASNLQLKSPPMKDTTKKYGYCVSNVKAKKKSTLPITSRAHSTGSMASKCSKLWGDNSGSLTQWKEKEYENNLQVCSCHALGNLNIHSNSEKDSKSIKCMYCDDMVSEPVKNNKNCHDVDYKKQNQVLHKEVLFSNSEGTIEVTVTQKPSTDKQNDNFKKEKTFNTDKNPFEKQLDSCKCQLKFGQSLGQKWSEILWMNSANKKEVMCNNLNPQESASGKELVSITMNKENVDSAPITNHNFTRTRKSSSDVKKEKSESQTSCCGKENCWKDSLISFYENNPAKVFQLLNNKIEQKQSEQREKSPVKNMQNTVSKQFANQTQDIQEKLLEGSKSDVHDFNNQNCNFLYAVKKLCDGLMTEKKTLSEKLAAKDKIIATMKNREEEYLCLISNLKSSLSKAKKNVQDSASALKEFDVTKQKLVEQVKVSEALKLGHSEMQRIMEKCILENERLKTELQIFRLESQKHDVLLAGKEAEIKRYKEEIENFQKQISYHLCTLKSNAQEIDVEKMMEAIIQQSQIFIQTDLESILVEPDQKDSQKQSNKLMHSSPTSTKTSAVNSSWKQISSIRDNDQNQGNTDNVYTPTNEDGSREKEFFQIFGADSKSDSSKEEVTKKPSGKAVKKSSSFTSCTSVQEDNDWVDLSTAKEETITGKEKEIGGPVTSQIVQNNIDELLENMKIKWSRQIYDMSANDETIDDDFSNSSQISSISVNNEKEQ